MAGQDILAIVNDSAGTAYRDAVEAASSTLRDAAQEHGNRFELASTKDLDALDAVLDRVGGRRLVLLGGDGSLSAAVQCLHRTGRLAGVGPIGIIPLGTGNDLARSLRIPTDPVEAARCTVSGQHRSMELLVGEDGDVAVNAVHLGIGATAAAKGAAIKKRLRRIKLGKLGYPLGALAAGFSTSGWRLSVTVDGVLLYDASSPVLMVALGLGGTVGGGARLIPSANPHDGYVDVVVWKSVGPAARVGYALGLKDGDHARRSDVKIGRGQRVDVRAAAGQSFMTNNDGDLLGPFISRHWEVQCDAWQVMVPAAGAGDTVNRRR